MIEWLADRHWVIKSRLPIWLFNKSAFAFYPFVFVRNKGMYLTDEKWQIHELEHLKQQLRGWLIGFYVKYVYYHFKCGYENNPYEIAAREAVK